MREITGVKVYNISTQLKGGGSIRNVICSEKHKSGWQDLILTHDTRT